VHQPVKMNRNAPAKRKARVYRPVRRFTDHCADAGAPVCPVASDSLFARSAARRELATTAKQHIFRSDARKTVVETLETKRDCLKDRCRQTARPRVILRCRITFLSTYHSARSIVKEQYRTGQYLKPKPSHRPALVRHQGSF
jgi:hypothetical protein